MAIELKVDGYFELTIYYLNGKQVGIHNDKDIEQGILDNLQQGEYLIGINSKTIVDINDMNTPLYTFEIEAGSMTDYEFENK